ncbi:hypothetical protein G7Z17_g6910 [Cylindrodendrum hubeiense]|uniref:Uncharacterized protein n=1 Tax=Cylindrodendrum hubeiense TaxID=595255 RepID=A0A9P5H4J0_9HYPO|nr:hypothetical protein G7Z17_g6910 [Cylindrodendrum hubeiense]
MRGNSTRTGQGLATDEENEEDEDGVADAANAADNADSEAPGICATTPVSAPDSPPGVRISTSTSNLNLMTRLPQTESSSLAAPVPQIASNLG